MEYAASIYISNGNVIEIVMNAFIMAARMFVLDMVDEGAAAGVSARPAKPDDFFPKLLLGGGGHPGPEQVDRRQLVTERLGQLSEDAAGADHDLQVRRLVPYDIGESRAWTQPAAERGQMPLHAAEVQLGDARVLAFEPGGLAHFDTPLLDQARDALDALVALDEGVIGIRLVHAAGIGPDHPLLESPQVLPVLNEPEQHAFEPGCPRVVLFVGIGGRGEDHVDGRGLQKVFQLTGVGKVHGGPGSGAPAERCQVIAHRLDAAEPGPENRRVLPDAAHADLGAETEIADFRNERRGECEPFVGVDGFVPVLLQNLQQYKGLVERPGADRVLQEQTQLVGRQRPQSADRLAGGSEEGRFAEVIESLAFPLIDRPCGDGSGVADQRVGIDAPVQLGAARVPGNRVALDPDARNAEFLALDQRGSGAAEGIQHSLSDIHIERFEKVAHEVRREREDEAVPVVNRPVSGLQPIAFRIAVPDGGRGRHDRGRNAARGPGGSHHATRRARWPERGRGGGADRIPAVEFSGAEIIKAPRERVWKFVTDAESLAGCVPGVESFRVLDPGRRFEVTGGIKLGTVALRSQNTLEWTEQVEQECAQLKVRGRGPGTAIDGSAEMRLRDVEGGTALDWKGTMQIRGTVAALASRLLRPVSERILKDVFARMKSNIED